MAEPKHLPGKFVWFELAGRHPKAAQAFYAELLGWKTVPFPVGGRTYEMIFAGETPDTMIGGYERLADERAPSRWVAAVSVEDVDAAVAAAAANGGRILDPPRALPGVGRSVRIADPGGAELTLFRSDRGDPPDVPEAPPGRFFWHELHTNDANQALAFYEKVVGFDHHALDMGPAGTYHVVSKGGVDRGGVTRHLPGGMAPHWLPYVKVDDVDGTLARAAGLGARVTMGPHDIPGIGRFGVISDPTGALLALMRPNPRQAAT